MDQVFFQTRIRPSGEGGNMCACRLDNRCTSFLAWGALLAATFALALPDAHSADKLARIGVLTVAISEQSEEAKAFRQGLRDDEVVR